MELTLEDRVRAAVSALNRSRGEYAGGWNLYTPEDTAAALARLEILASDTREHLTALDAVILDVKAAGK